MTKIFLPFCLLCVIACAIWFGLPHLSSIINPEKRIYIITILFLLWLLKLLWSDFKNPLIFTENKELNAKVQALHNQFAGAWQFLNKTALPSSDTHLIDLPWYLFIGPKSAGKTSFLANTNVNYILKRESAEKETTDQAEESAHCDWWVTKDATFIDVPAHYLFSNNQALWHYLLSIMKQKRGKLAVQGLIIAVPLPELMQEDLKEYLVLLQNMFKGIEYLRKVFKYPIPCTLVITKCDLLPGFKEFFAELSLEEINQPWGINLDNHAHPIENIILQQFNLLIKRLNDHLLSRLHHERNPLARPFIKDFPLQIERIKSGVFDILKRVNKANLKIKWQGVYLTSATQSVAEHDVHEENTEEHQNALQVYQGIPATTRSYFITQLLTDGFKSNIVEDSQTQTPYKKHRLKYPLLYATSLGIISLSFYVLYRDFNQGLNETHSIQSYLATYQDVMSKTADSNEQLFKTVELLDQVRDSLKSNDIKFDLAHLNKYYSTQSHQKTQNVYHDILQNIFLPEIKQYLEEYLTLPVNRDIDDVYATLKIYLMLGNPKHMKLEGFIATLRHIMPNLDKTIQIHFYQHLSTILMSNWQALNLNEAIIQQTRKYLTSIPNLQLSYIILMNHNDNNHLHKISAKGFAEKNNVFEDVDTAQLMLNMYTHRSFDSIISTQINSAAEEAIGGNWVLGDSSREANNRDLSIALIDQLRIAYVNNYIDAWENLLKSIRLVNPKSLKELDHIILKLSNTDSPLLQLLKIFRDNTYFEPIISTSPKLQHLGLFFNDNGKNGDIALPQVFAALRNVHVFIEPALSSRNSKKASFDLISNRLAHQDAPDALTQLRLVADRCPEPLKAWLEKIADQTLNFLMHDASQYINTSWQEEVVSPFNKDIAKHYPFNTAENATDIKLKTFINFFGSPGTFINFYKKYLQQFINADNDTWRWKRIDNMQLAFSDDALKQIQRAFAIHHAFFPKGNDMLSIKFTLQPYKFSNTIKKVALSLNNKKFIDLQGERLVPHPFSWPRKRMINKSYVRLVLENNEIIMHKFSGSWAWLKMINQLLDTVVTNKEMIINVSRNTLPAQYMVLADNHFNSDIMLHLHDLQLPNKISSDSEHNRV